MGTLRTIFNTLVIGINSPQATAAREAAPMLAAATIFALATGDPVMAATGASGLAVTAANFWASGKAPSAS